MPKEPYTEIQLGYDDPEQRITKEQADEKCRVEIAGTVEIFEQTTTATTTKEPETTSATEQPTTTAATTTERSTETASATEKQTTTATTERTKETTMLGEHDTPYIPIP